MKRLLPVIAILVLSAVALVAIFLDYRRRKVLTSKAKWEDDQRRYAEAARIFGSPVDSQKRDDAQLELIKLEYTAASSRYENIYKAIWQNFSYMSVLAAAILTFGAKQLSTEVIAAVALAPLAFWYVATFLPMDHYGDRAREHLERLERTINRLYFTRATDATLSHFTHFRTGLFSWRVRHAVNFFGVTVLVSWIAALVFAVDHLVKRRAEEQGTSARASLVIDSAVVSASLRVPQMQSLQDSMARLSERVDAARLRSEALMDSARFEVRELRRLHEDSTRRLTNP